MNYIKAILNFVLILLFALNSYSQELKIGMTPEKVKDIYGVPDSIVLPSNNVKYFNKGVEIINWNKWIYGIDTVLVFHNDTLNRYHFPFMNVFKHRNFFNDSLKKSKLIIFLYDTLNKSYFGDNPGHDEIPIKDVLNLQLKAFFKTPNSYQEVDSIVWLLSANLKGFTETAQSNSFYLSRFQTSIINYKHTEYFFISVVRIILKSGLMIEYPILKNEKYIVHANFVDYKYYTKIEDVIGKLDELKNSKVKNIRCPNQPVLVFKLQK